MEPPNTRARANWAVQRATALPEVWALVAEKSGLVGAWRLMRVCKAARQGAKEWLRTLPGLVVCGGVTGTGEATSEVWRLDLGELRWERMPALTCERAYHACCAVRGAVVVLGGQDVDGVFSASVEILKRLDSEKEEEEEDSSFLLPELSRGPICCAAAVAIEESESDKGQVLLLGGINESNDVVTAVHKVDLANGVCTAQPFVLPPQLFARSSAARLSDGRIVCVGTNGNTGHQHFQIHAQVLEPSPEQESASQASWQWRNLPVTSDNVHANGLGAGCVLSDGRFAFFGGATIAASMSSCAALTLDSDDSRWDPLPPMHFARHSFACRAVGGCVIVAGGGSTVVEVYDESLRRWRRLPCNLPHGSELFHMASALM
jgi:hypothetical protein